MKIIVSYRERQLDEMEINEKTSKQIKLNICSISRGQIFFSLVK